MCSVMFIDSLTPIFQFQGEWFEIETYPKDTQPGECIKHQFINSTNDASLDFVSTNVLEQLLGTSVGNVTLYPDQNGGRLTLSVLDSNGTRKYFLCHLIGHPPKDKETKPLISRNILNGYKKVRLRQQAQCCLNLNVKLNVFGTNLD